MQPRQSQQPAPPLPHPSRRSPAAVAFDAHPAAGGAAALCVCGAGAALVEANAATRARRAGVGGAKAAALCAVLAGVAVVQARAASAWGGRQGRTDAVSTWRAAQACWTVVGWGNSRGRTHASTHARARTHAAAGRTLRMCPRRCSSRGSSLRPRCTTLLDRCTGCRGHPPRGRGGASARAGRQAPSNANAARAPLPPPSAPPRSQVASAVVAGARVRAAVVVRRAVFTHGHTVLLRTSERVCA